MKHLLLLLLATVAVGQTDPSPTKMLIAPMGLQDGDICIVHDNLCTKIEGATAPKPEHLSAEPISADCFGSDCPKPETTVVGHGFPIPNPNHCKFGKDGAATVCDVVNDDLQTTWKKCPASGCAPVNPEAPPSAIEIKQSEPMDVAAFKREIPDHATAETCMSVSSTGPHVSWCKPEYEYTCTDKRRIKLQSEDGAWHCILFKKEPN